MNYLIVEILGCLIIAGVMGAVLGWFLRGGCQKKLERNSLDWQEKLRADTLSAKNKISVLEENFLHQLQDKDEKYKLKVTQMISNKEDENSDVLKNEIITLKKKLDFFEKEQIKNEQEWTLLLEDAELGVKNKLVSHEQSNNRIHQENIFLKGELDRSVSELNDCEQENKKKEQALNILNTKVLTLEDNLIKNGEKWETKLEESELRWVDKVALIDEMSFSQNKNKNVKSFKTELITSKKMVKEMADALENCENKLKEKSHQINFSNIKKEIFKLKKDNLKLLRGVGVLVEEKLNSLGIYTFIQIASWSDNDIVTIDEELSLKGQIRKERWVEQASKIIESE